MSLPRRDFLGIAGATGLLAAAGSPLHAATPSALTDHVSGDGILPITAAWDMTWVDRIKGRHRAVFDSPGVSDGAAMFRAVMWMNQYREVYGTDRKDMSPVVILRHTGTLLAMNDDYWTKFDVAKEIEADENPGAPAAAAAAPATAPTPGSAPAGAATVAPATAPASSDAPVATPAASGPAAAAAPPAPRRNPLSGTGSYSLSTFQAEGGIVLVCNIAFGQAAGRFRRADRTLTREASLEIAKAHLAPGVILQPSGIFAALRAQEAGCHYIIAG